jgi:hypothetical protein
MKELNNISVSERKFVSVKSEFCCERYHFRKFTLIFHQSLLIGFIWVY